MPHPSATSPLLKAAEAYLSALHGSVARHDNLAANLGCAGCELRDRIRTALTVPPEPTDRAAVLLEAAQHLYTALFPAVYDDMGQKAAEGVQRAVSELRRLAVEAPTTKLQPDSAEEFDYPRDPDAEEILNTLPPEAQRRIRAQLAAEARQDGAQPS
jgi:hypothetical protein